MKSGFFLSAAILGMSSGLAIAQQSPCCNKTRTQTQAQESEMSEPTVFVGAQYGLGNQPEVHSKVVMVQNDDEHEYKVMIEDGKVQAWADGEKVSKKHLKIGNDSIRILNDDGDTVAEFARGMRAMQDFGGTPPPPPRPQGLHSNQDNDGPITWRNQEDERSAPRVQAQAQGFKHPSVMLGIQMGQIDEDTSADLKIDPGEAIKVMKVIKNLPAEKAGLRKGDIIVRVDGKSVEDLGDILMDKEAGQKIKLRIVRGDDEKTITVKLAAWDDEALGIKNDQPSFFQQYANPNDPAIQELIEKIEKLQFNGGEDQKDREGVQKKIEKLLREYSKSYGNSMELLDNGEGYPRMRMFGDGDGQHEFSPPRVLVDPDRGSRDLRQDRQRIDDLESRLERMEDRLDRIVELLEKNREHDND